MDPIKVKGAIKHTKINFESTLYSYFRLLEMSLNSTSGIRKQDADNVITNVAKNQLGQYLAFSFIRNRWKEVKAR